MAISNRSLMLPECSHTSILYWIHFELEMKLQTSTWLKHILHELNEYSWLCVGYSHSDKGKLNEQCGKGLEQYLNLQKKYRTRWTNYHVGLNRFRYEQTNELEQYMSSSYISLKDRPRMVDILRFLMLKTDWNKVSLIDVNNIARTLFCSRQTHLSMKG